MAPKQPQTIGDHIRKRRLKLKMQHKTLRGIFAIHIETLKNWERNVGTPMVRHLPAIIRFLDYVPFGHDDTPGGRLAFLRRCAGLTQRQTAHLTGVDTVSLWRYERNRPHPDERSRRVWDGLVRVMRRNRTWQNAESMLRLRKQV